MQFIFGDGEKLAAYAAPATERSAIWRVLVGLVVFAAVLVGATILIGFALTLISPNINPLGSPDALATSEGVLFALATFILWWPGLWLALRLAHRRGWGSIFAPTQAAPARLFAIGFAVAVGFGLISVLVGAFTSPIDRSGLSIAGWVGFLPFALILLVIQTGAEEVVFRGYLLQQMAARFRGAWWAWALIPSLLFGALHFNPAAPGGVFVAVAVTSLGGFILAIVSARTGGIAAAWGIHMGVNTVALLIIGPPDYLSGLSLWHWVGDDNEISTLAWLDFVWIAAIGLGAAWWFRPRQPA